MSRKKLREKEKKWKTIVFLKWKERKKEEKTEEKWWMKSEKKESSKKETKITMKEKGMKCTRI